MTILSACKTSFNSTLLVAGMVVGLGVGISGAVSAVDPTPEAHSDGLGATISDTVITAKVKAQLMSEDSVKKSDIKVVTLAGWPGIKLENGK